MNYFRFWKILGISTLVLALVFFAQFGAVTHAAVEVEQYGTQDKPIIPKQSLFQLIPHDEEKNCSDEIKKMWLPPKSTKQTFIPTILQQSCFKFDLKQYSLLQKLEPVTLPLFQDTSIEFHPASQEPIPDLLKRKDSSKRKKPDNYLLPYSWAGQITQVNGLKETGTVVLVVDEARQAIEGVIRYGTTIVRIQPLRDGLHAVIEINPTGFPDEADPEDKTESTHTTEHPCQAASSFRNFDANDSSLPDETDCTTEDIGPHTVDILVFYTTEAMKAAGGTREAFKRQLDLTIKDANMVNEMNEIPILFNLVGLEETTYHESGELQLDLDSLASGNNQSDLSKRATALRNKLKADLVSLFVETGDYCGIAKPNDWNNLSPDKVFSVVVRHCSVNHLSMLHEFGHNMGATHNLSNAASSQGFAHGHRSNIAEQYTIMAIAEDCGTCKRIPYWSSPDYTYVYREEKRGDEGADNTTALRTVACRVAKFR